MIIEICLLNDAKGKLWRIDIHFIDYRSTAYYVISLITLFFLDKMENIITRIHCIPYTPHLPKDLLSTLLSTAYLVISLIRRWSNMVRPSNGLPLLIELWNLQLHNLWSNTSWTESEISAKIKLQKLIENGNDWKLFISTNLMCCNIFEHGILTDVLIGPAVNCCSQSRAKILFWIFQ